MEVFYAGRSMALTTLFAHYSMHRCVPFCAPFLSLSLSLSLAKIRLHLCRRNFLMVSRRVVARYLAYRHVRALHRRVAMLRISAYQMRDITRESRLMGDPGGGILQEGLLADDIMRYSTIGSDDHVLR